MKKISTFIIAAVVILLVFSMLVLLLNVKKNTGKTDNSEEPSGTVTVPDDSQGTDKPDDTGNAEIPDNTDDPNISDTPEDPGTTSEFVVKEGIYGFSDEFVEPPIEDIELKFDFTVDSTSYERMLFKSDSTVYAFVDNQDENGVMIYNPADRWLITRMVVSANTELSEESYALLTKHIVELREINGSWELSSDFDKSLFEDPLEIGASIVFNGASYSCVNLSSDYGAVVSMRSPFDHAEGDYVELPAYSVITFEDICYVRYDTFARFISVFTQK